MFSRLCKLAIPVAVIGVYGCSERSVTEPVEVPSRVTNLLGPPDSLPGAYVVLLRDDVASADAFARDALESYGGTRRFVFEHIVKGFSVENFPESAVAALKRNPNVTLVEPVRVVYPDGVQSLPLDGGTFQFSSQWGLDRLDEGATPTFNGQYAYFHTGVGVHVYIVDSGVNGSHVEFSGRQGLSYGTFLVSGQGYTGPWSDAIGHGTAVAGLAAGSTYGLAKNATIHSVRIDAGDPGADCDVIVDRLDWIVANVERPAAVNLSYGGVPNCFVVERAVERVIAAGITMAKSAGNDNVDAFQDRANRPTDLIVVGALNHTDGRAFFCCSGQASNFGPYLALFAPGVDLLTAGISSSTSTQSFSGTSGAAPLATGAAAILLEGYPSYTPFQVRGMLVGNASNVTIANGGTGSPNKVLYANLP